MLLALARPTFHSAEYTIKIEISSAQSEREPAGYDRIEPASADDRTPRRPPRRRRRLRRFRLLRRPPRTVINTICRGKGLRRDSGISKLAAFNYTHSAENPITFIADISRRNGEYARARGWATLPTRNSSCLRDTFYIPCTTRYALAIATDFRVGIWNWFQPFAPDWFGKRRKGGGRLIDDTSNNANSAEESSFQFAESELRFVRR